MWPVNRKKRNSETLGDTIAHDKITRESKDERLILLYDEATILLFEKPKSKTGIKKI